MDDVITATCYSNTKPGNTFGGPIRAGAQRDVQLDEKDLTRRTTSPYKQMATELMNANAGDNTWSQGNSTG